VGGSSLDEPVMDELREAIGRCAAHLARAAAARQGRYVNAEGGDVAATGNARSLVHHVASYVAAAALGGQSDADGILVDVGSGVGALSSWLAARLGRALHLVDADPAVRAVAAAAFPGAGVHASLQDLAPASAGVVAAMEVVEHVPRTAQLDFVRGLVRLVAPGGVLVVSTPDETSYLGRSSGYGPHVGCVDAAGLEHLLTAASGSPAQVWRLEGPAFAVGRLRRVLEPTANRAWAGAQRLAPRGAERLASAAGRAVARGLPTRDRHDGAVPGGRVPEALLDVRVVPADRGCGTGLVGAVRVPS
jgi:SAM-dependent methyltransferase